MSKISTEAERIVLEGYDSGLAQHKIAAKLNKAGCRTPRGYKYNQSSVSCVAKTLGLRRRSKFVKSKRPLVRPQMRAFLSINHCELLSDILTANLSDSSRNYLTLLVSKELSQKMGTI